MFTPQGLDHLRRVSKEIERVPTVQRVYSLATANTVEAIGSNSDTDTPGEDESEDEPGGIRVEPLIDRAGPIDAAAVKARALRDPMLVGDLLSKNGRVASILINFDEDRIDAVRGGTIEKIHEIVARDLPAGIAVHFNGSIEISETYNRVTVDNMEKFTPPILLCTLAAIYLMFRSVKKTLLTLLAIGVSLVLDARPLHVDGILLQRPQQHDHLRRRRARDSR